MAGCFIFVVMINILKIMLGKLVEHFEAARPQLCTLSTICKFDIPVKVINFHGIIGYFLVLFILLAIIYIIAGYNLEDRVVINSSPGSLCLIAVQLECMHGILL